MATPIPGTPFSIVVPTEATGGRLVMLAADMPVGLHVDPHIHHDEDQITVVISGTVGSRTGEEVIHATAGEVILHPRGVPHELWNEGQQVAHVLEIYTPGGHERVHEQRGRDALTAPTR